MNTEAPLKLDLNTEAMAVAKSAVAYLRSVFLERRAKNPAYSTRAFARDLGMSQALLSMIFNGKRALTVKQATQIATTLGLPQAEADALVESALRSLPKNSKGLKKLRSLKHERDGRSPMFMQYEVERFKLISQWYHVALVDLSTTKDFKNDPLWIARRLGIGTAETLDAIERLVQLGFLERAEGQLRKPQNHIYFTTKRSEPAVRQFHRQMMRKASEQLEKTDEPSFEQREISSMTMAIRKDRLAEARKKIQTFQKELAEYLTAGESEEVYQLNVQFFPLTQRTKE